MYSLEKERSRVAEKNSKQCSDEVESAHGQLFSGVSKKENDGY
jgi:hypothetical protein